MKIIGSILVFCCVVISICIFFIVRSGVSLHPAPYIKPSVISADSHNIAKGIFVRLFPDLQKSHYVLWGISMKSAEEQKAFEGVKDRYEDESKMTVTVISNPEVVSTETVRDCPQPCWIILPEDKAHELAPNVWIQQNIAPLSAEYITITWVDFERSPMVPDNCEHMKYLDFTCIKAVAVNAVERKMKEKDQRYFFMQKYQDRDHFLFVEKAH